MNLGTGNNLEKYFLNLKQEFHGHFPHDENYVSNYEKYSGDFYKWVHAEVGIGGGIKDNTFLTNHGNDHIKTVIQKASSLCESEFITLEPFEIYLLLMSIHVHDVGNILGRQGHHNSSAKIIELFGNGVVKQNKLIWDFIFEIAKAHKGEVIQMLAPEEHLYEIFFRPQLLAAILKFADELAENSTRASLINLALDNIPPESLIYHQYAHSVNTIKINHKTREIMMTFDLDEELLHKKFLFEGKDEYLVDYIYQRTLKTYAERIYCMKFLRPFINLDTIKVTITVRKTDKSKYQNGYELTERGIENINMAEVLKFCPSLTDKTGAKLCQLSIDSQL